MKRKHKKRNVWLFQASIIRQRRRRKKIRKRLNIRRNSKKKDKIKNVSISRNRIENVTISLDSDFRLLVNTDKVIETINKSIDHIRHHGKCRIWFELSDVTQLDIGAVGLLLTAVNLLSRNGVSVVGTLPNNEDCRDFLIETGYLEHVYIIQGKKPKRKDERNLLIERGFDKTSNTRIGDEVRKAVKYLTNQEHSFRPVYSIIQEMCANSIEHANYEKRQKNWLVSIYYTESKVVFTMTDIGKGIIATLKKKVRQKFKDTVRLVDEIETLKGAFDKKYQSSTFEENRNQGLPKIKEASSQKYIDNLKVITNNVFVDFTDDHNSRNLKHKLRGTFYYWELTRNNIDIWKKRNS